jgi:hypothetical protein
MRHLLPELLSNTLHNYFTQIYDQFSTMYVLILLCLRNSEAFVYGANTFRDREMNVS